MISSIIVHHNGKDMLDRCLKALYNSQGVDLEVIVVDNASSDDSIAMLRMKWPNVRLIELAENTGFAYANNKGIEKAKGDAVLLMNNDVLVNVSTVARLWEFARKTPNIGAVVPLLRNSDQTIQRSFLNWPTITKSLLHFAGADTLRRLLINENVNDNSEYCSLQPRPIKVAKFACVLLTKKTLQKVGILDDTFFMYGEDADWSYRAYKAGLNSFLVPTAEAVHLSIPRVFNISHPMFVHQYLGVLLYFKKHSKYYQHYLLVHSGIVFLRIRLAFAYFFNKRGTTPLSSLLREINKRLLQKK